MWRHEKTGGWYWTIKSVLIPAERRGKGRYSKIPLVPIGGRGVATRQRDVAVRCQRRLWGEWSQLLAGQQPPVKPRSIEHWLQKFRDYNQLQAAASHVDYNAYIVANMFAASRLTSVVQLGHDQVARYLAGLKEAGRSARTIQAHRNSLHKFCRFLVRHDLLDGNPVDAIEVAGPERTPPRYLDDWQQIVSLDHLSMALPAWTFDGVLVALFSGARLSTLRALRCEHVHAAALVLPLTKVGDYSVLPLADPIVGPELRRVLLRIRNGRPGPEPLLAVHDPRHWGEMLARSSEPLQVFGELPGFRAGNQWHLLRSTWAVNCARRGATLWQLMEWGGWKIPQTVLRYVNIARAAGRQEVARSGDPL